MDHTDILIHFANSRGFKSYLEIGVQDPKQNYLRIPCEYKCGVDPDPLARWNPATGWINHSKFHNEAYFEKFGDPGLMVMTSDEFFEQNGFGFDLIFIDGDHSGEQTYKDIVNASRCLSKGGLIVVHDVLPANEKATEIPRKVKQWNGTSYKGFICAVGAYSSKLMGRPHYTIDTDFGIGICYGFETPQEYQDIPFDDMERYLNLTSLEEWKKQEGI